MRYAIDRYNVGIEKEVNADDFDGQRYIPNRQNRFFCPECGEIVFFRAKGGNKKNNEFYHQTRTERSPECDKRVDGRSNLSLTQRVGLPLYLTGVESGHYHLNIGFPALGPEILQKASISDCSVEISAGTKRHIIQVNKKNFVVDATTLIPVNFIPEHGQNYDITISTERSVFGLQRKWSDHADGFDEDGAIFLYEETGGKKVRHGDNISTNKSYYVVTRHQMPIYAGMQSIEIGKLKLGFDTFRIFKIKIAVSIEDKNSFLSLRNFLQQHFGVWLLESQPELIPIWPPVVQRDYYIPVVSGENVICAVSSGNVEPDVYIFTDYGVAKKEIKHSGGNICIVDLALGERPIILSVDRKYVGREVTFMAKEIQNNSFEINFEVINETGTVPWENISQKTLSAKFAFISNSKIEIYIGTKDRNFRHISIREQKTNIPERENTNELFLLLESRVIRHIRCQSNNTEFQKEEKLYKDICSSKKGIMVPVPYWVDYFLRSLKRSKHDAAYNAIMSTISDGRIYAKTLETLRIIELENSEFLVPETKER